MRNLFKRLLCLATVLALALSLAACGGGTSSTGSADASGSAAASGDQAASTGDKTAATGDKPGTGDAAVYNGLFDTSYVHTVDITISEEDWADLQANPLEKTKYKTTVTIDGEAVEEVSFATKGNTSLSSVASSDSNRYSFKLNFGKYNKEQTYHGLNKLSLNNLYADATCLKDYLSYQIFRQVGVDAPLASFVWVTINGEDHGLYLALEDVSESWLDRTNGGEGVIYKPETEMLDNIAQGPGGNEGGGQPGGEGQAFPGGGDNQGGFPGGQGGNESSSGGGDSEGQTPPETGVDGTTSATGKVPEGEVSGKNDKANENGFSGRGGKSGGNGDSKQSGFPGGNGQGGSGGGGDSETPAAPGGENGQSGFPGGDFGGDGGQGGFPGGFSFGGSNGADLKYTDDDPASYSDIFDNNETKATEEDEARVIAALKGLSEGEHLEDYLDTDEIIRYFAAHNFVLNYDSYTGSMLHNYYLLEQDGKLSMLPWDYNLGYGGFTGGNDTTGLINTGIDTPLSGSTEDSRPMWAWIANDETYLEQYHQVYEELLTNYFESGAFEAEIDALYELLRPYVEKDPTAFYTVEEFDAGVAALKEFCLLRAQSIRAQLNGTLSARTSEQSAEAKIDASGLDISVMGSQGGGQGGENGQGGFPGGFGGNGNESSSGGGDNEGQTPPTTDGNGGQSGFPGGQGGFGGGENSSGGEGGFGGGNGAGAATGRPPEAGASANGSFPGQGSAPGSTQEPSGNT